MLSRCAPAVYDIVNQHTFQHTLTFTFRHLRHDIYDMIHIPSKMPSTINILALTSTTLIKMARLLMLGF